MFLSLTMPVNIYTWHRFDTLRWRRVVDQPKGYAGQIACRLANVHLLNSLCSIARCSPTFGRSATHGQLQHPSTVSSTVQWHRCSMLLNLSSSLIIWLRKSIEHDHGHYHGPWRCLAMLAARSCKLHACLDIVWRIAYVKEAKDTWMQNESNETNILNRIETLFVALLKTKYIKH